MSPAAGVPSNRPVALLNVAQLGRLAMLNVNVPPSRSLALGVNEYCVPAVAVVDGVPVIVGGLFGEGAALTAIENAGNSADTWPSLTLITMPVETPTSPALGVPTSCPVEPEKLAQLGRLATVNVSALPFAS
jgi:hypothetical protein